MNKSAIATILATAALSIAKKASGSHNQGITVTSLDELIRHANDPNLATLVTQVDISHSNLSEIPSEIGKLINLEYINLGYNEITSIPPEIGKLNNLTWIDLNGNEITSIPSEIGNLENLTRLSLHNNQITSIPTEIGKLNNLKVLGLGVNPNLKVPASTIRRAIQSGMNPYIIKKLMEHLDTTPRSPIRRF